MTDTFPADPPLIRCTAMPENLNPYGDIFGGWIMSQMALAAGSLASRHAGGRASLIGAEKVSFKKPVNVGDEFSVWPCFENIGRSSMTIYTEAWRRDRDSEFAECAATGYFTLVAVDKDKRPRAVPPIKE